MKKWLRRQWTKIRGFFVALLLALGFIALPVVNAGPIGFSWTNPSLNVDGSVYTPATDQLEIRIYCNGDTTPTFVSTGDGEAFSTDVAPGTYTCHATAVNLDGIESGPSNTVTKTVEMPAPNPPVLN